MPEIMWIYWTSIKTPTARIQEYEENNSKEMFLKGNEGKKELREEA